MCVFVRDSTLTLQVTACNWVYNVHTKTTHSSLAYFLNFHPSKLGRALSQVYKALTPLLIKQLVTML